MRKTEECELILKAIEDRMQGIAERLANHADPHLEAAFDEIGEQFELARIYKRLGGKKNDLVPGMEFL